METKSESGLLLRTLLMTYLLKHLASDDLAEAPTSDGEY